jgi:integrase
MPSAWVTKRTAKDGSKRHRVMYRLGGRESVPRYGGSFKTQREAVQRRAWILGELAAKRVPDIRFLEPKQAPTLLEAYERWQASRVDVSEATSLYQRSAIRRAKALLDRRVDEITAEDVATLVGELAAAGRSRETIRKTITVLSMVLDFASVQPNPARDRVRVRLPREDRAEIQPPTAAHVEAVHRLLASTYRLPLLILDSTGMRVGELEQLTWGDVDEQRAHWRVSAAVSKTGYARWVSVPPDLFPGRHGTRGARGSRP